MVCGCVSVLCAASMGSKGVQGHVACSVPGVDSHTCKDSEVQAQVQPMCTCPMAVSAHCTVPAMGQLVCCEQKGCSLTHIVFLGRFYILQV